MPKSKKPAIELSATSLSQGRNRSDYKPLTPTQRKVVDAAVSLIPAGRAVKVGAKVGSAAARSRVGQKVSQKVNKKVSETRARRKAFDENPSWGEFDVPRQALEGPKLRNAVGVKTMRAKPKPAKPAKQSTADAIREHKLNNPYVKPNKRMIVSGAVGGGVVANAYRQNVQHGTPSKRANPKKKIR
jgi:hypothetical protein